MARDAFADATGAERGLDLARSVSAELFQLGVDSNAHDEGHVRWLFDLIKRSRNVEFSTE